MEVMEIYRARSSAVWGWVAVGTGVVVAVWHVSSVGLADARGGLGLGVAMAAVGVAAFLRPHVAVGPTHAELHNVTQVVTVPYARLASLDTRWALEARGDDGRKASAFAAPAPGAAQTRRIERSVARESGSARPPADGRAGDAEGTPSGDAAAMVRRAWEAWRESGHGDPGGSDGPSLARRIDPVGAGLIAAAIAAALWGLFS